MTILTCIQMTSSAEVVENLQTAERLIASSAAAGARLVVLPENFALMGRRESDKCAIAEDASGGPIQDFLSKTAEQEGVWIVGGTIPIKSASADKVFAATLVYDAKGQQIARYDKIHLFDVDLPDAKESYHESDSTEMGRNICMLDTPVGRMGVAVCYDLRFPEMFRLMQLQGMEVLVLPSAFTAVTGAAHWQPLLQARAIENQCYVAASAQVGVHDNKRATYGHSMVINPWGKIEGCLPTDVGIVTADIDLEKMKVIREKFPALKHRFFN